MQFFGRSTLGLFGILLCLTMATPAIAAPSLVGTYILIQDDDGTTPSPDAVITLTFNEDGSLVLSASLAKNTKLEDKGTWSLKGNKLSIALPDSGKATHQNGFSLEGRRLTLPFRVFSDEKGSSLWRRSAKISFRPFAQKPEADPKKAVIVKEEKKSKTPEVVKTPPATVETETGAKTEKDVKPARPLQVFGPPDKKPTPTATTSTSIKNTETSGNVVGSLPNYVGRYQGTAVGSEVRYRKEGVFTLSAKHLANFWFTIDETGQIAGAGQITYALDADRKGLGESFGEVEDFAQVYVPGDPLVKHSAALVGGTVTKDIEIKGSYNIQTQAVNLFIISPLGELIYEYESRGKRATRPFPAWSAFPKGAPGVLEVDKKGNLSIELDLSGKGRRDKWQEFRFVWNAKKVE